MQTRQWTWPTSDDRKRSWGDGPWLAEPEKVQWEDGGTGLPCLARRSPLGMWCGYVGLGTAHPFYGLTAEDCALRPFPCDTPSCDHRLGDLLAVHGGLTFSGLGDEGEDSATALCHVAEPGEDARLWWLGWDAGHFGDYVPMVVAYRPPVPWMRLRQGRGPSAIVEVYRPLDYVRTECARLALQLDARDWECR